MTFTGMAGDFCSGRGIMGWFVRLFKDAVDFFAGRISGRESLSPVNLQTRSFIHGLVADFHP